MAAIQTINPATEETIQSYPIMADDEVNQILDLSHQAYLQWRQKDFTERAQPMKKVAQLLRQNKNQYAQVMAQEMGKPITAGEAEIEKCAWACEHFADQAEAYLQPRHVKTEMSKSYVTYQPLGIVFAIMPWNFPFWQVFRFAAPALMAGNGAVLKHAPITTGCAFTIETLLREAGFPEHLFRTVTVDNEGARKIIEHPHVAAVTLTGSARAGRAVGAESAQALKKVVLELGGSDPYLILPDADIELAAETCVKSRLKNSGQVCIAAKRMLVDKTIYDDFLEKVQTKVQSYQMGDPMDPDTNFGPLARQDLRENLHQQVQRSIEEGAKLLSGGEIPQQRGFYYPPTILTEVKTGMTAFNEELFGPVVSLIRVHDEDEAIQLANATNYGLGAAVFTQDTEKGERIASTQLEAGACAVNTNVASDPRLPFGGIKGSGYGRELSAEGIQSFTNIKTVTIR